MNKEIILATLEISGLVNMMIEIMGNKVLEIVMIETIDKMKDDKEAINL